MRSNRKYKHFTIRDSRRWIRIGNAGRIKALFADFTNKRIYRRKKKEDITEC